MQAQAQIVDQLLRSARPSAVKSTRAPVGLTQLLEQAAAAVGEALGPGFAGLLVRQQPHSDTLAEVQNISSLRHALGLMIVCAARERAYGERVSAFVHIDAAVADVGVLRACAGRIEDDPMLRLARELAESAGARLLLRRGSGRPTLVLRLAAQAIDRVARARERGFASDAHMHARLDGMHVVLVEDDPDALEFLALILRHAGARVSSFGLAQPAYDFLTSAGAPAVDVIVSDIAMPGEDGYSLIQRLRSWERAHDRMHVPAIAVSAFARDEDARRALAHGFDRHLAKPLDGGHLIELIACWGERAH